MDGNFAINIGRQLGSGGKEIGEKLAQSFDISFYDKELLNIASKESGLSTEFFENADEKTSQNLISGLFGMRFPFVGDTATSYTNYLSNDALFKIQSDVIRKLADDHSCVFVGRCADYVLRDYPRCVNIFICANIEERIDRIMKRLDLTEEKAESLIERVDKRRADYYNYYSFKTWGAAQTYHICIDSSVLGINQTVEYLKEFVVRKLR